MALKNWQITLKAGALHLQAMELTIRDDDINSITSNQITYVNNIIKTDK